MSDKKSTKRNRERSARPIVRIRIVYRRLPTRVCVAEHASHGGTRRTGSNIKENVLRLRARARKKKMRIFRVIAAFRRAGAVAQCDFDYDAPPTAVGKLRFFALSTRTACSATRSGRRESVRRHELCSWRGSAGADGMNIPAAPRSPRQGLGGSFVTFLPAEKS